MNCTRLKESLFLHAHEELGGVPRLLVEHHLRRCPACRAKWSQWNQERSQWRRALAAEVELNGSAGRVRDAVASRIRAEPRERPQAAARRTGRQVAQRRAALVLLALLLALMTSAFAAFGPSLGRSVHRLWIKVHPPSCDQPLPVNQTPPGGTEDSGPTGASGSGR
jgi:anti-sigma factor RsiW